MPIAIKDEIEDVDIDWPKLQQVKAGKKVGDMPEDDGLSLEMSPPPRIFVKKIGYLKWRRRRGVVLVKISNFQNHNQVTLYWGDFIIIAFYENPFSAQYV